VGLETIFVALEWVFLGWVLWVFRQVGNGDRERSIMLGLAKSLFAYLMGWCDGLAMEDVIGEVVGNELNGEVAGNGLNGKVRSGGVAESESRVE
jgi:hypothetical protein